MTKEELYRKLKNSGIFWSYDKDAEYLGDNLLVEHTLIWADVPDIMQLFKIFDFEFIKDVWERKIAPDERYFKLNVYLAFIFFNIQEPYSFIEETSKKYSRYERIKSIG